MFKKTITIKQISSLDIFRYFLILVLLSLFSFLWRGAIAQDTGPSLNADVGHARVIEVGTPAILDGTGSTSSSGLQLSYAWTLTQQQIMFLSE